MILGLTGRMGAGKDTVCERLKVLLDPTPVRRKSFADPLKDSVCALFGITRGELEMLKNEPLEVLALTPSNAQTEGQIEMTMRTFLQRYGTEAHRDIFGQDFWLDVTLPLDYADFGGSYHANDLIVLTDCRFPNEAQRVQECSGLVMEVVGPQGPMHPNAEHASERALPDCYLDGFIDNEIQDGFSRIDRALHLYVIPKLLGRR